jgi:hypothetical protein
MVVYSGSFFSQSASLLVSNNHVPSLCNRLIRRLCYCCFFQSSITWRNSSSCSPASIDSSSGVALSLRQQCDLYLDYATSQNLLLPLNFQRYAFDATLLCKLLSMFLSLNLSLSLQIRIQLRFLHFFLHVVQLA